MQNVNLPHYNGSLTVDGITYRVSARIIKGAKAAEQVPVHSHSQYELLVFYDGSTYIQTGSQTHLLQGGQCCLLRPRTYHLRRCSADTTKYCTLFIQGPEGSALDAMKQPCQLLTCGPDILCWFSLLEKELCSRKIGADSNVASLLHLILVDILRELDGQHDPGEDRQGSLVRYEDIIDDFFSLRYAEDLRIGDLAQQLGVTSRHLSRIMQQSYGCTFRQRLLEIRLYYAREYLSTTQLPISQIAIRCGFTAENAFSAAFRKSMGCTPSQFRSQHPE